MELNYYYQEWIKGNLPTIDIEHFSICCTTEKRANLLHLLKHECPIMVAYGLAFFINSDLESIGVDRDSWLAKYYELVDTLYGSDPEFFRRKIKKI